ncbi:hypothetical protein, conserved [Babesia bigemina]|uniref:Uncharacterized protein n=1 Tax=Babesia bigemina TaxID=5866 RepID=A0A061CYP5_BABBI|nr:hypothetical protein, conserved [Babesia bigemina]CDR93751.1 hypothetical protein, conserved [Babesia bigemina]|eukprot:XP_012765937.1 hypothetical protein, conserved [Babesia bigemina]
MNGGNFNLRLNVVHRIIPGNVDTEEDARQYVENLAGPGNKVEDLLSRSEHIEQISSDFIQLLEFERSWTPTTGEDATHGKLLYEVVRNALDRDNQSAALLINRLYLRGFAKELIKSVLLYYGINSSPRRKLSCRTKLEGRLKDASSTVRICSGALRCISKTIDVQGERGARRLRFKSNLDYNVAVGVTTLFLDSAVVVDDAVNYENVLQLLHPQSQAAVPIEMQLFVLYVIGERIKGEGVDEAYSDNELPQNAINPSPQLEGNEDAQETQNGTDATDGGNVTHVTGKLPPLYIKGEPASGSGKHGTSAGETSPTSTGVTLGAKKDCITSQERDLHTEVGRKLLWRLAVRWSERNVNASGQETDYVSLAACIIKLLDIVYATGDNVVYQDFDRVAMAISAGTSAKLSTFNATQMYAAIEVAKKLVEITTQMNTLLGIEPSPDLEFTGSENLHEKPLVYLKLACAPFTVETSGRLYRYNSATNELENAPPAALLETDTGDASIPSNDVAEQEHGADISGTNISTAVVFQRQSIDREDYATTGLTNNGEERAYQLTANPSGSVGTANDGGENSYAKRHIEDLVDDIFADVPRASAPKLRFLPTRGWMDPPLHIQQCYERLRNIPVVADVQPDKLFNNALNKPQTLSNLRQRMMVAQTLFYLPMIVDRNEPMLEKYAVSIYQMLVKIDDFQQYNDLMAELMGKGTASQTVLGEGGDRGVVEHHGGHADLPRQVAEKQAILSMISIAALKPIKICEFVCKAVADTEYTVTEKVKMLLSMQKAILTISGKASEELEQPSGSSVNNISKRSDVDIEGGRNIPLIAFRALRRNVVRRPPLTEVSTRSAMPGSSSGSTTNNEDVDEIAIGGNVGAATHPIVPTLAANHNDESALDVESGTGADANGSAESCLPTASRLDEVNCNVKTSGSKQQAGLSQGSQSRILSGEPSSKDPHASHPASATICEDGVRPGMARTATSNIQKIISGDRGDSRTHEHMDAVSPEFISTAQTSTCAGGRPSSDSSVLQGMLNITNGESHSTGIRGRSIALNAKKPHILITPRELNVQPSITAENDKSTTRGSAASNQRKFDENELAAIANVSTSLIMQTIQKHMKSGVAVLSAGPEHAVTVSLLDTLHTCLRYCGGSLSPIVIHDCALMIGQNHYRSSSHDVVLCTNFCKIDATQHYVAYHIETSSMHGNYAEISIGKCLSTAKQCKNGDLESMLFKAGKTHRQLNPCSITLINSQYYTIYLGYVRNETAIHYRLAIYEYYDELWSSQFGSAHLYINTYSLISRRFTIIRHKVFIWLAAYASLPIVH